MEYSMELNKIGSSAYKMKSKWLLTREISFMYNKYKGEPKMELLFLLVLALNKR